MGWAGGHIGAVWAVFIQVRVAAGGHICPQQGRGKHAQRRRDRAPRRNKGESTAPSVWRCPPRHPGLPAYCPQPTAKAIWPRCGLKPAALAIHQSGRSGLLCGVVGEPHKRQARERARSRCNDHGARRMRGKRAVSKAGLCRRQQAGCMGRPAVHEQIATKRQKAQDLWCPKAPCVCVCMFGRI